MHVDLPDRPPWLPFDLYPFKNRTIDAGGATVHYIDEGDGPTLLFLHGNPTWSFVYREIIRDLRTRFRCIALDYPGFGLSRTPPAFGFTAAEQAAVVDAFVEALDLADFTIVVHDWGGPIGLSVAARRPQDVRALVAGNTWAWPVARQSSSGRFSRVMGSRPAGWLIQIFNLFVNVMVPFGTAAKLPREVMAAYRGPFPTRSSRRPTHVFPRQILEAADFLGEVEKGLGSLSHLPLLIVWGDRDPAFSLADRTRFEAIFPHHRVVVLGGARHFIQEDAPGLIAESIGRWWDEEVEIRSS